MDRVDVSDEFLRPDVSASGLPNCTYVVMMMPWNTFADVIIVQRSCSG